jgi:hypothetical protein
MATDESPALNDETNPKARSEAEASTAGSIAYDEVNLSLTTGYKPTIVVSLVVALSFVLLGGIIPGLAGSGGGMTTMTYTIVGWGIVVGSLGFIYEYWIERNQTLADE